MKIFNHEPIIKTIQNGLQITFTNRYTVLLKNGPGTASTQIKTIEDPADYLLATRFGGIASPDVECEIYDRNLNNITSKFTSNNETVLGYITPMELVNLLYVVSALS